MSAEEALSAMKCGEVVRLTDSALAARWHKSHGGTVTTFNYYDELDGGEEESEEDWLTRDGHFWIPNQSA